MRLHELILDESVKIWFNKKYNMICTDPRLINGCWVYLADLELFFNNKFFRFDHIDKRATVSGPSIQSTEVLVSDGNEYPIGSRFAYVIRDSKTLAYTLGWRELKLDTTRKTKTTNNYILKVPFFNRFYIQVNSLIFPIESTIQSS